MNASIPKLTGLRVLNTRPLPQGKVLSQAIESAGGTAIECPALMIDPIKPSWLNALPPLALAKQAIFTSANAVHAVFTAFAQQQILWPATIQVIAVGQATAAALNGYEVQVSLIPAIADSEHLLQLPTLQAINQQTILLFKGIGGRTLIAETLSARGADLHIFDVYRRIMPPTSTKKLHSLWHNKSVDIILFTSHQAMHNIFSLFGKDAHAWLRKTPCVVISERLAKEAALLGVQTIIVSTPGAILNTLHQFNQGLINDY